MLQRIGFDPALNLGTKGINIPLVAGQPIGDPQGNKVLMSVEFPE
jgi:hypothetical protein